MLFKQEMVLDRGHRNTHVSCAHHQVKNEEQKVALVLQANTIVYPRTVMVHQKNTCSAHRAVVRPCWLYLIAKVALFCPKLFKLFDRLAAIPEQLFDITGQALKPAFFVVVVLQQLINRFAVCSVLLLLAHFFNLFLVA